MQRHIRLVWGVLYTLAFLLLASVSIAQSIESRSGERVDLEGTFADMVFAAGGKVSLNLETDDDVYAIGGDIDATNLSADHLSLAGGDITLAGIVAHDLLAASGNLLLLDGRIEDDVIAGAGDLVIREGFSIGGSAILSGAVVELNNAIGGDVRLAGEEITLNGVIRGSAKVRANRLVIGESARIDGDLEYSAKTKDISKAAVISGELIELEPRPGLYFEPILQRAYVMFALFGVMLIVGLVVLVLVTVFVFPGLMNRSRTRLLEKPLPTLGIGFLITLIGPALIALLFASVFGIPLALMIGVFYVALAPIALAAAIYATGDRIRGLMRKTHADLDLNRSGRLLWTMLATLVFLLIGLIPIIGGLVWTLALVVGFGAVAQQAWISLARDTPLGATSS